MTKLYSIINPSYEGEPIDAALNDDSEALGAFTIVRLKTSWWHDKNGLYQRKEIKFMKRMSKGAFNLFEEDCQNIGAEEVFAGITNLYECDDGLYTVATTNERHEWESGTLDGYDYILIPFTQQPKTKATP